MFCWLLLTWPTTNHQHSWGASQSRSERYITGRCPLLVLLLPPSLLSPAVPPNPPKYSKQILVMVNWMWFCGSKHSGSRKKIHCGCSHWQSPCCCQCSSDCPRWCDCLQDVPLPPARLLADLLPLPHRHCQAVPVVWGHLSPTSPLSPAGRNKGLG